MTEGPAWTNHPGGATFLLLVRLIAGGLLLVAGGMKLMSPWAFALSIDSFKLVPQVLHLPLAYFIPWLEVVAGAALVLGWWSRESAATLFGLLAAFTVGLISVLVRGLKIDCGCFSGLFGEGTVGWHSVLRNVGFLAGFGLIWWVGPGSFALDRIAGIGSRGWAKDTPANDKGLTAPTPALGK